MSPILLDGRFNFIDILSAKNSMYVNMCDANIYYCSNMQFAVKEWAVNATSGGVHGHNYSSFFVVLFILFYIFK